ncbi:MAG: tRNA glutamyl-Q(34) synthetase GluQRS [Rubrobacter sp.]|nr:tRNA glutamyl-Q(34) synthetase GluQRS [Rubrobacter sp.]
MQNATHHDGRFAPSPTGDLHIGNLRTALLSWLFARKADARFLVRVEDLDRSRVKPGIEEKQLADLRSLGLEWDGEAVRQSERTGLYDEAIRRLDEKDFLYPCFCTRADVRAASSAPHGIPGHYPGTCRNLTERERAEREASGRPFALRVRGEGARVVFEDRLLGGQNYPVDDFVVWRNDGSPAYQIAVVVDDAEQRIGEVVRGADLVDSTPRQLFLADLLGLDAPRYAHVPLVLGPDGERLAKRHGAVTMADREEAGETPEDVLAWMAHSLGLAEAGEEPGLDTLLARFDPALIPTDPTIWRPR